MANHNKKGDKMPIGKPFVPGDPRAGRPKHPPELQAIQRLSKGELEALLTNILRAKPDELKSFNNSVLELWLSSGAVKAIQSGDYSRLEMLLQRLIGKVPDVVEIEQNEKEVFSLEAKKQLLQRAKENIRKLEEEIKSEESKTAINEPYE